MAEINELILQKLQDCPPEVRQLAIEVVKAGGHLPPQALQEHVETLLRRMIRTKGDEE